MDKQSCYDLPRYELYFRSGGFDSMTVHRFLNIDTAIDYCKKLNNKLKEQGYNDREYIVVKVSRDLIYESEVK